MRHRSFRKQLMVITVGLALVVAVSPLFRHFQAEAGGILTDAPVAKALAAGGAHACAIYNTVGKVYCWGKNDRGQLGDGTNTDSSVPVAVSIDDTELLDDLVVKHIRIKNISS